VSQKSKSFLILGFLIFVFFTIFSYFVHANLFTSLDFNTTVKLQNNISHFFDMPFSLLSLLGSFEIVVLILIILLVKIKKLNTIFILLFFGLIHIVEFLGKAYVTHPGPPYLFFRYDISFNFPTSYIQPGSSYPSGHLARTLFLSIIISYLISRSKRISNSQKQITYSAIILFDVLMFLSRIYLGEHWLSDVIGGSILGASLGIISLAFL